MAWFTFRVDDPAALDAAAGELAAGGVVILPTETVYGVGCLPGREDVLAALKHRPESMPIAVLVASVEQAENIAGIRLPSRARQLAARFWPGPLTLVVPAAEGGTIGLRCPDYEFVRRLATRVGPIATTSANRHGEPTPATAEEAARALAEPGPSLVIDGGRRGTVASTVVDVSGDELHVLREGAVSVDAVRAAVD